MLMLMSANSPRSSLDTMGNEGKDYSIVLVLSCHETAYYSSLTLSVAEKGGVMHFGIFG